MIYCKIIIRIPIKGDGCLGKKRSNPSTAEAWAWAIAQIASAIHYESFLYNTSIR